VIWTSASAICSLPITQMTMALPSRSAPAGQVVNFTKLKMNAAVNPGVDTPCACSGLGAEATLAQMMATPTAADLIRIPIEDRGGRCGVRAM
jgi:hypothetical protein